MSAVLRCEHTGNPCGSDTYTAGFPCMCDPCVLSRTVPCPDCAKTRAERDNAYKGVEEARLALRIEEERHAEAREELSYADETVRLANEATDALQARLAAVEKERDAAEGRAQDAEHVCRHCMEAALDGDWHARGDHGRLVLALQARLALAERVIDAADELRRSACAVTNFVMGAKIRSDLDRAISAYDAAKGGT